MNNNLRHSGVGDRRKCLWYRNPVDHCALLRLLQYIIERLPCELRNKIGFILNPLDSGTTGISFGHLLGMTAL